MKMKLTHLTSIRLLGSTRILAVSALLASLMLSSATGQTAAPAAAAKAPGVIRIRAGSSESLKDSAGNTWEAERGFEGGSTIDRDPELAIENTKDPALYRSEHYSMDSFSCDVPNGKYTVKLHFAETFDGVSGEGQRVFSFNVQGKDFKDFDVFKKAGGSNKAYIETVPVEVKDGKIKITFTSNIENPEINAIEIAPDTGSAPVATATAPAPAAAKGAIRIRAGSAEALKDSAGNTWEAERGFEGGSTIDRDPELAIENTKDPALYRSEHYSMDSFSCDVPNGKYTVKLHFAETFDGVSGEGQRVFSFNVQGKDFKDFDVFKKAGGSNKAYIETVPVEVKDGKIKITFTSNIENPEINAIEIIPDTGSASATAAPTPAAPTKDQGAIRIRAGSSEPFKDSEGNTWKAEEGFEGGSTIDRDPELAIANTKDPGLYRSEHYSMDSFSITVPNGKYVAKLHFAETFDGVSGEGQRVFSFNVQGKDFKDFDVFKKAGGSNKAYIETVPVEVKDGKFKITFTSNIENPQINAIELVPQK